MVRPREGMAAWPASIVVDYRTWLLPCVRTLLEDRGGLMASTRTDIVDELRAASATLQPIGVDLRFLLVNAADYIELLKHRLEKAEELPWWRFW